MSFPKVKLWRSAMLLKLYRKNSPFMTHEVFNLLKADSSLYIINNVIVGNEGYIKLLSNEDTVK